MSMELAERLKIKLTDKFVVVDGSVPELKRFADWTGKVKTVNMNGRALVEFDGPADIGWYDIDPAYLTVVDGPRPKAAKPEAKAVKPAAAAPAAAKPAAAPAGGKSPLDMIRAQQAAKAGGAAPAAAPPAAGGAKMSPLDMIRAQQAAKQAGGAAPAPAAPPAPVPAPPAAVPAPVAETPAPAKPAAVPTTGPDGKPLSKLDQIRMMGAAKR